MTTCKRKSCEPAERNGLSLGRFRSIETILRAGGSYAGSALAAEFNPEHKAKKVSKGVDLFCDEEKPPPPLVASFMGWTGGVPATPRDAIKRRCYDFGDAGESKERGHVGVELADHEVASPPLDASGFMGIKARKSGRDGWDSGGDDAKPLDVRVNKAILKAYECLCTYTRAGDPRLSCALMECAVMLLSRVFRADSLIRPEILNRPDFVGSAAANLAFKFHHGMSPTKSERVFPFQASIALGSVRSQKSLLQDLGQYEWWLWEEAGATLHVPLMSEIAENAGIPSMLGSGAQLQDLISAIVCCYCAFDGFPGMGKAAVLDPCTALLACVSVASPAAVGEARVSLGQGGDPGEMAAHLAKVVEASGASWRSVVDLV